MTTNIPANIHWIVVDGLSTQELQSSVRCSYSNRFRGVCPPCCWAGAAEGPAVGDLALAGAFCTICVRVRSVESRLKHARQSGERMAEV